MSDKTTIVKKRTGKRSSFFRGGAVSFPARVSFFLIIVFFLLRCTYEFPVDTTEYHGGQLDLTSFVVVGDDYLSGFMDGALYTGGQQSAPGAILAGVLQQTGTGMFSQADIASENGLNAYEDSSQGLRGRYVLVFPDDQSPEPLITTMPGERIMPFEGDRAAVHDLTIPFLRSWQIDDERLTENMYYARMALPAPHRLLIERVDMLHPTTFLLWLGMSDIMGYATTGGGGDTLAGDPSTLHSTDLTPVDLFREKTALMIDRLLAEPTSKGVVLLLPSFDDFPFFYYYSYDFIKLPGKQLSLAKATYREFNDAVAENNSDPANPKRPYIDFNDNGYKPYPQPVVVVDTTLPDAYYPDGRPLEKYRQLQEDEMVLMSLPADLLQYGLGSLIPLPGKYYLSAPRIQTLRHRIAAYNVVLREEVAKYPGRLVAVDLQQPLHEIAVTGKIDGWGKPQSDEIVEWEGVPLMARRELYSIYSLDGLHLNGRGNAWLTTFVAAAMERAWGSVLPAVDVNNYKGDIPRY